MGAVRRPRPAAGRAARRSSTTCRSHAAGRAPHRRAADRRARPRCRCRAARGCRPRRASAGSSTRSGARATASSPTASSRPRPTSRSRPISAPGSTGAASSTAPSRADVFREQKVVSAQRWAMAPRGQHIELGIAENNLFLLLAALGLAGPLFGARLLPIGTLYDPFIKRGLDALNYACYQDARFMLVATPSGVTLAPEGGAHQSVIDAADRHRPARPDRVRAGLSSTSSPCCCAGRFEHMQRDDGGSVYLRLSTRPLDQPERTLDAALPQATSSPAATGCASRRPAPSSRSSAAARSRPRRSRRTRRSREDFAGAGLLAVTSPGPAAPRLAGAPLARPGDDRGRRRRAPAGAAVARARRWSPCSTAIRRRCPGSARVRGHARRAARRRALRPVRRHPRPLPRVRARLRRHHRRRGARLPARRRAGGKGALTGLTPRCHTRPQSDAARLNPE